ncbi:MAG TPA: flagellar motor switch protein FliG [Rhodothermales bacterium]
MANHPTINASKVQAAEAARESDKAVEKSDKKAPDLNGAQKAAVLLLALGTEAAVKVMQHLGDHEVERISIEIARLKNVSSEVVEHVLVEYRDLAMAQDYIAQGGVSFAREVLDAALGPRRAEEIMMRVEAAMEVSAFHLLQTVETVQLTNFLQNEHPQTAALILSRLNPRKSADIVAGLPPELQTEIVYRLATMGKTSPELMRDIEDVIRQQIGSVFGTELSTSGGVEKVAEILNNTSRGAERNIVESLRERDADLANAVKDLMFVFDDLVNLSDRDLQRILVEVEQKDLAFALKATSDKLKEKLIKNVSERAAAMIQEEMELMGPVRVRDVEDAQRRIIDIAHQLEEQEEITMSRSGDDVLV